ncbi:MAG: radical SAM-associated putative lipoprotein [Bacteroidales bacterium]|nr:radical SAM-associated putative lipoprotein [Bacteroidales bacterium]
MGKPVIKLFDKIIVILLSFFGIFNSCTQPDMYGMPYPEYGTPYADYEIKGVVTNKENAHPLQNIRVIHQTYSDTLYTDSQGKYAFNFYYEGGAYPERIFHLKVEDIDGEENGGDFTIREIELKITEADRVQKGDGNWYEGKFGKTENVELEKKQ